MTPLRFSQPATLAEAIALLGQGDARPLAGGTDLVVQLREGRRRTDHVVDLKRIAALTTIAADADGGVRIGAATSCTAIASHPAMARYPALAEAARMIGSHQIQNRATIGGNVCNGAPSADAVPPLICLGAQATVAGPAGQGERPVEALFAGPGRTALGRQEILASIRLPPPAVNGAGAYARFTPRREMDIAVAGVGAWLEIGTDGAVAAARIALAAVGPTPMRARAAERSLVGRRADADAFAEAGRLAADEAAPISDTRGSADYRRELVRVLTARTLETCRRAVERSARR